jgi:hypothetical protein
MPRKHESDDDDARPERVGVTITPAALGRQAAADLCGVSLRVWDQWIKTDRTPKPIVLPFKDRDGNERELRRLLWSRVELEEWVFCGMPDRPEWEALRRSRDRLRA